MGIRKGESIHSPETCLPGGGWEFRNAGAVTLPLKARNGEPMRANRAFMEKGAYKQLSYFWFPSRDRVLTNAWEMKIYNFWDACADPAADGPDRPSANEVGGALAPVECSSNFTEVNAADHAGACGRGSGRTRQAAGCFRKGNCSHPE